MVSSVVIRLSIAQIPERVFSWRSPPYKMKQVHWASPSTAVPLEILSVYLKYPLHKPPSFDFNYASTVFRDVVRSHHGRVICPALIAVGQDACAVGDAITWIAPVPRTTSAQRLMPRARKYPQSAARRLRQQHLLTEPRM